MAKQPESKLQLKIRKALEKEFGGWWFKMWGGPFTKRGIPDLIGCVEGLFIALEVKMPKKRKNTSAVQKEVIWDIIRKGRGVAAVVTSEEEAINVVYTAMAEAAKRLRVRSRTRRHRTILRAAHGKDLCYYEDTRDTVSADTLH